MAENLMDSLPPKLRDLPPPSTNCRVGETVWEIDVPQDINIIRAIALSYLMTVSAALPSDLRVQEIPPKIKKIIRKFNPFRNRHNIHSNCLFKKFIINLENQLLRKGKKNYWLSILLNGAKYLKCVIHLYSVDSKGKCENQATLNRSRLNDDCPRLIIFHHFDAKCQINSLVLPKFSFGLPLNCVARLRRKVLINTLREIGLSGDEINEIPDSVLLEKNFLLLLLQSPYQIPILDLYKPPYHARKLAEAGFAVDPRLSDENGFSAFHHCMDLQETRLLWLLYNFAANMSYSKNHSVRNPNGEILDTLEEIGEIIERDFSRVKNLSDTYKKSATQILSFNQYQREMVQEIIRLKQSQAYPTKTMITILNKYEQYFHFKSNNFTLNLEDELGLFQNFIEHTEYHENLDAFNCIMLFDYFPHIIEYIDQTTSDILTDNLSAIFQSILSNNFFPKYEHELNGCSCGMRPDICERENNSLRFVSFYHRQCFLENAITLRNRLEHSFGNKQSSSVDLLKIVRDSLRYIPEIEDEFMIVRLKRYLEIAKYTFRCKQESACMLTFERSLQVIGEILQNETASRTVVKTLVSSCFSADLRKECMKIRNHCLCKYRSSSVQGRIAIEKRDRTFLNLIDEELQAIHKVIKTVFDSQKFRIEEFLIEKCKTGAARDRRDIVSKLDRKLTEINCKRKEMFLIEKEKFVSLLFCLFKYAITKLEDFKEISESLIYFLKFVASHYEENSIPLLQMRANLLSLISNISEDKITDQTKLKLNEILVNSLKTLENTFFNIHTCQSPSSFSYPTLQSLYGEMKNFDVFSEKEKMLIKEKISDYVENSNETMGTLIKNYFEKNTAPSMKVLNKIIMPQKKLSELWKCCTTILDMNLLHEVFLKTKDLTNKTLFQFLRNFQAYDDYEIFSGKEKTDIKTTYEVWLAQAKFDSSRPLIEFLLNDSVIFYNHDPAIKMLKDQLNKKVEYKNKQVIVDELIFKNVKHAKKILDSVIQKQKLETWYKPPKGDDLNFQLEKEEHLSVLLKIDLPVTTRIKIAGVLNQKMWFLRNRICHMKRLLIFEDEAIDSLWKSRTWKHNKDEERHLKSMIIQRFSEVDRVRVASEMLLFDCMLILQSDELIDLWKKSNNMFCGANLIQILSHGNPLIESAGALLDPTDLHSDIIDKMLNLIEDEPVFRALCLLWINTKFCKHSCLKEFILSNDENIFKTVKIIKECPKWESYLNLLPLKR